MKRRAFSFVEVLFAVMILGVGFIMIAAVFPVSLSQVKLNTEETNGASLARAAVNYLEQNANNVTMTGVDGRVYAFTDIGHRWIEGDRIQPSDRRYGWMAFYRRQPHAPYAQIILIPAHARVVSQYETAPTVIEAPASTTDGIAPDGSALIQASITNNPAGDVLRFYRTSAPEAAAPHPPAGAVEGAYVIIAEAHTGDTRTEPFAPNFNGNIVRLGRMIPNPTTNAMDGTHWELAIGADFEPMTFPGNLEINALVGSDTGQSTKVFVIGQGPGGEGLPQDISAYTTFIGVN